MSPALANLPPHTFGRLSGEVFRVLGQYTALAWPIMLAQCRRRGIDACALTPTTLGCVIHGLALAVARHNDAETGLAVRRALVDVQRTAIGRVAPSFELRAL